MTERLNWTEGYLAPNLFSRSLRGGGGAFWNIQKGVSSDNGPESIGKGRHKPPSLWRSINTHHSAVMDGEGASCSSQNRAGGSGVENNSVFLPATSRVTWGSAGAMRMDQVGSGARQALGPITQWAGIPLERLSRNWGRSGLPSRYPTVVCSGHYRFQCPSFRQKAPRFQPRWLPGYLLDLFTPPGSPLHSRLIRADKRCNFLLASCPYWPPLLSLSCYRPWRPPLSRLTIGFGPRLKL